MSKILIAVAAAIAASMSAAYAGPCSPEVTEVQDMIDARIDARAGAMTAPESTAAKMHHQPTPSSIAAAEGVSPEKLNAVSAAMARARQADGAGDRNACEQALAEAKRLIGSAGTQTDDAQR